MKAGHRGWWLLILVPLAACGGGSTAPENQGVGPNPALPDPEHTWFPTLHIAPAKGWSETGLPHAASGLKVNAFAKGLDHPRWLYVLPNGDVLVAETNAPPRPDDGKGLKNRVAGMVMKRAGAGVPSANRITLLRDADGDGVADTRSVLLEKLNSPFGMALVGNALYIANTDALLRFTYQPGQQRIETPGENVVDLPGGTLNHHWTKNVIAAKDGQRLYVTVGSNSNAAENGIEQEADRAAILEVDPIAKRYRVFASGLRNPNGMGWQPESGALWTVANERDELGNDLVPDYLTSVRDGGFYGWPYSYYGQHVDERVKPQRPDLVAKAIPPDYALGSHVAALGLAFSEGSRLPARYRDGAFIGLHGSWNRKPRSGYKVIFVPFSQGRPSGLPEDVLTGFVDDHGEALGRPVGVAIDRQGALLVADDVGNTVWRVDTAKPPAPATAATGR